MTIFDLIDAGDADGIRVLVAREPAVAAARDEQGLTALVRAAYRGADVLAAVQAAQPPLGPFDRIVVGLSDGLPAPDALTPDGFTALHIAAFVGNAEAARQLLAAGADPNALATAPFARVTPLGTCAFVGANDVAKLLLEHGADASLTGEPGGGTPLDSARRNGNDELVALLGG
jgi:ankyrin repeat protein